MSSFTSVAQSEAGIDSAVLEALCDDLNTPKAISELHQLRNKAVHGDGAEYLKLLVQSLRSIGLLQFSSNEWSARKQAASGIDEAHVKSLISGRTAARARKDFAESDRIRDELAALGVAIKDGKDADGKPVTTWEIAR
jgi:cysteinyl-tRNA synthetase